MGREEILEILSDWNLWRKQIDTGIKREEYVKKAVEFLGSNMIICITGIRRAGKSYIMRQIAEELIKNNVSKNEVLIVNFEDRRFSDFSSKILDEIFETYIENLNPKGKPYIFLDEVHRVEKWERWVRTFNELRKAKIIVSGSTSQLIKREFSTLLTGRHLDISVFPLSFKEFLRFKEVEIRDSLDLIEKKIEIKRALKEYLEFGGFPEVALSKSKKEILLSYFDDILTKDIFQRYKVRKINQLESLARFYLTNISNPITFSSIEKFINISSDTIEKFSYYLEEVGLLFFIRRFSPKVKEQEKSPRKVYSIDVGLSNAIGFKLSENLGSIAENVVAVELKRQKTKNPLIDIFYWKSYDGREVDFVVKENFKVNKLIQVCWNISDEKTRKREVKGLIKAMEEFRLKKGSIITEDYEGREEINKKVVEYIPLWKWLLSSNS